MPTMFEDDESKPRCPDCSQSLTFVRTRSHQKKWYCYSCERFIDQLAHPPLEKHAYIRLEALNGLQVIDSHGMIVGRVRKVISNDAGDIKSLLLSVDKDQFKTILDERDLPREFEVGHDRIATVGDVVILDDAFSPRALTPPKLMDEAVRARKCGKCGIPLIPGAKHCIGCGTILLSGNCGFCGTNNPIEALFCKNCGNRIS